jgi:hypothetical protein
MLIASLIGALMGIILGLRFKVFILIPFISLTIYWATGAALLHATPLIVVAETAGAVIASLQIGYVLGIGLLWLRMLARAGRPRNDLPDNTVPRRRAAH